MDIADSCNKQEDKGLAILRLDTMFGHAEQTRTGPVSVTERSAPLCVGRVSAGPMML